MDQTIRDRLLEYNCELFAPEDEALRQIGEFTRDAGMPAIGVSADVGQLLYILARSVGARRALEVGTLAGYSGTWIARALPADGKLITLELEARHKDVAERGFAAARLMGKVEVRLGPALESLEALPDNEPFDFVFIDAAKHEYPDYLRHCKRVLRRGGILTADNTLFHGDGALVRDEPLDEGVAGIKRFNEALAADPDFAALQIPLRDGVAVALRTG
jgi:caffeoyl-CoA O-methyltransferase